jgi:hypothetical protein
MCAAASPASDPLRQALGRELLRLAKHEDDVAACEAAQVQYWQAMPRSIAGHRGAAAALRAAADELLADTAPVAGRDRADRGRRPIA